MFLFLLFFNISTQNLSGEYANAIRTTGQAIGKQTGAEQELNTFKDNLNNLVKRTAKNKGVDVPLTIVTVGGQAAIRKRIEFKTGPFTIKGSRDSAAVLWTVRF